MRMYLGSPSKLLHELLRHAHALAHEAADGPVVLGLLLAATVPEKKEERKESLNPSPRCIYIASIAIESFLYLPHSDETSTKASALVK